MQLDHLRGRNLRAGVSILIRPEGRMQPDDAHLAAEAQAGPVSILIRPEGRMQRRVLKECETAMFQSSSAPRGGCNMMFWTVIGFTLTFQSSSAPRGGCNLIRPEPTLAPDVSILIRPEGRMQHAGGSAYTP